MATDNIDTCINKIINLLRLDLNKSNYKTNYAKLTTQKFNQNDSSLLQIAKLGLNKKAISLIRKFEAVSKESNLIDQEDDEVLEVEIGGLVANVQLETKSCSCRDFIVYRLPCPHLIAALNSKLIEIEYSDFPDNYKIQPEIKENKDLQNNPKISKNFQSQKIKVKLLFFAILNASCLI